MFWLAEAVSHVVFSAEKQISCSWKEGKLMCLMKWSVWLTAETLTLTNETLASGFVTLQGKTNGSPSFMYTTSGISDCTFTKGRWLSEMPMLRSGTNRHCIQTVDADNNLESATNTQRMLACYQTLSLCCFLGCTFAPVAIFLWQWKALGVARPIVRSSGVIKGTEKNLWTF